MRARAIGQGSDTTFDAAFLFNGYACPVMSYIPHLVPLPKDIRRIEMRALSHLLHILFNTLPHDMHFSLAALRLPEVHSIIAKGQAAAVRAAHTMLNTWRC